MIQSAITIEDFMREKIRREKARRHTLDFTKYTFKRFKNENWHHKIVSNFFDRAINKEFDRGMIFLPPRHGKTETEERAGTRAMGKNHNLKIAICAYGATKARKISEHIKRNVTSPEFIRVFPNHPGIREGSNTKEYWEIGDDVTGLCMSAGVDGPITGEGFNLGFIDDPVKSREEAESIIYQDKVYDWYEGTFLNRQDESDSVIILTSTRWHRSDLAGQILENDGIKEYNGHPPGDGCPEWNGQPDGKWTVLSLPALMDEESNEWKHPDDPREIGEALWPQRFPSWFLEQFQKNKYNWNSLFQQRPKPKGGNIIDRAWFPIVDDFPIDVSGSFLRFWDFAGTEENKSKHNDPDYTAGALVYKVYGHYYLVDLIFLRSTPKKVEELVLRTAKQDQEKYGQVKQEWEEEGGFGGKLATSFYNEVLSDYLRGPYRTQKEKAFYIDLLSNKAETGNISCLRGPWLYHKYDGTNTFFDQLEEWPKGRHDDGIDAMAKAVFRVDKINSSKAHVITSQTQAQREIEAELF
ncbi:MAG: hypothetical protein CMI54_02430 [Parcubacteria group bacterium]|nr:hypothetical protein [Parcubacteria group bacterium]|tara:strand:+ start:16903 stop:18474 length:1572 start_codon:yes stop_codon:yes gene_type:complete